jgi:hypothetical protein
MKTTTFIFAFIGTIALLTSQLNLTAQDNIPWLSNYTSDIPMGSDTYNYDFKTVGNNACKISIEENKRDKKGGFTSSNYQFFLSDLNPSSLKFKTSGSNAIVSMEIKQSQKFIRIAKNGILDGYANKIDIYLSEVDQARSFIEAMKSNIEKCNSIERAWTSRQEAIEWLAQNIGKSEANGTSFSQKFASREKSYLVGLDVISTDAKGIVQSLSYDFNLSDINTAKMNMVVTGKSFKIELPVRENNYYIRMRKGADEIVYLKEIELYSDDMELARNIFNGMIYLVNETPIPERKKWDSYSAALGFVSANIGEVKSSTSTIVQSLNFDASPSGSVQLLTSKKDAKGNRTQENISFYLTDIQPSVSIEASSKSIALNVVTKEKNKYIKESNEQGVTGYSGALSVFVSDLEMARELARALESAIEKSEKGLLEFSTLEKAIDWMKLNVSEVRFDKEIIAQTVNVSTQNENNLGLKVITTGEKGTSSEEYAEIYPEDIKPEELKIKVSGKKLSVILSTGKNKYVKSFKDNILQNYSSDITILFDDVLKAKNFLNAITMLRNKSLVADRTLNDKASAMTYLMENIKKIEVVGVSINQRMEEREGEKCKGKYTRIETNNKGVSVETIFDLTMYDIDPKKTTIDVSSKSFQVKVVTKGKLIKPFKNGEVVNFIDAITIEVDDVLVAKKMLAAFLSLANFCN